MAMSEKQKMLAGELYHPGDTEILADQAAAKAWMVRYNAALAASPDERRALLAERLAGPLYALGQRAVYAGPLRLQEPAAGGCCDRLPHLEWPRLHAHSRYVVCPSNFRTGGAAG